MPSLDRILQAFLAKSCAAKSMPPHLQELPWGKCKCCCSGLHMARQQKPLVGWPGVGAGRQGQEPQPSMCMCMPQQPTQPLVLRTCKRPARAAGKADGCVHSAYAGAASTTAAAAVPAAAAPPPPPAAVAAAAAIGIAAMPREAAAAAAALDHTAFGGLLAASSATAGTPSASWGRGEGKGRRCRVGLTVLVCFCTWGRTQARGRGE